MIAQLLVSITTTLIIEIFIASLFFKINREKLLLLIVTNIMTNILANFGMYLLTFYANTPYLINLLIIEAPVLIIEVLAYWRLFNMNHKKLLVYTILANLSSASFGLIVTIMEIGMRGVIQ